MSEDAEMEKFVNNINYPKVHFVLKTNKEAVEEFTVDLSELQKVGKRLSNIDLKGHSIIYFQFIEGYYITKESFNNYFNVNFKEFEVVRKINKQVDYIKYHEASKHWEFHYGQVETISKEYSELCEVFDKKISDYNNVFTKHINIKKKLDSLLKLKQQKFEINKRILINKKQVDEVKKMISQKKSDLNIIKTILKGNTQKFDINEALFEKYATSKFEECEVLCSAKEKEELIKYMKKVERFRIVLASLKNKKTAELAFFFFNNICDRFYIIPAMTENQQALHLFYEKYHKELSVMTGIMAQILNYISYAFNAPLKFPILQNGSKSYIIKNKK